MLFSMNFQYLNLLFQHVKVFFFLFSSALTKTQWFLCAYPYINITLTVSVSTKKKKKNPTQDWSAQLLFKFEWHLSLWTLKLWHEPILCWGSNFTCVSRIWNYTLVKQQIPPWVFVLNPFGGADSQLAAAPGWLRPCHEESDRSNEGMPEWKNKKSFYFWSVWALCFVSQWLSSSILIAVTAPLTLFCQQKSSKWCKTCHLDEFWGPSHRPVCPNIEGSLSFCSYNTVFKNLRTFLLHRQPSYIQLPSYQRWNKSSLIPCAHIQREAKRLSF